MFLKNISGICYKNLNCFLVSVKKYEITYNFFLLNYTTDFSLYFKKKQNDNNVTITTKILSIFLLTNLSPVTECRLLLILQ